MRSQHEKTSQSKRSPQAAFAASRSRLKSIERVFQLARMSVSIATFSGAIILISSVAGFPQEYVPTIIWTAILIIIVTSIIGVLYGNSYKYDRQFYLYGLAQRKRKPSSEYPLAEDDLIKKIEMINTEYELIKKHIDHSSSVLKDIMERKVSNPYLKSKHAAD